MSYWEAVGWVYCITFGVLALTAFVGLISELLQRGSCHPKSAYTRMMHVDPSKSQAEHYRELLEERKDNPCKQRDEPTGAPDDD